MEAAAARIIEPLVAGGWARVVVVIAAYAVTLLFSGKVVSFFVLPRAMAPPPAPDPGGPRFNVSTVIGKCENIITVSFVLAGEATGLALVFTGKSLVRAEEIKKNPGFFLGGTLVNLVWAMVVAALARLLIFGN
jgi:hypothetical protein